VGGGTHPGSGLPVIFESARITSRLLLEDLGLPADHCTVADSGYDDGRELVHHKDTKSTKKRKTRGQAEAAPQLGTPG
jgi:hypothetical protein